MMLDLRLHRLIREETADTAPREDRGRRQMRQVVVRQVPRQRERLRLEAGRQAVARAQLQLVYPEVLVQGQQVDQDRLECRGLLLLAWQGHPASSPMLARWLLVEDNIQHALISSKPRRVRCLESRDSCEGLSCMPNSMGGHMYSTTAQLLLLAVAS